MRRIRIDGDRCNGCGLCVEACHEGAMRIEDGKVVVSDMLCDGMGDCLPACPADAISFFEDEIVSPMLNASGPQWPIKLELVGEINPAMDGRELLIAADCSAFTYPVMDEFCKDGIRIIACPKLGKVDTGKLTAMFRRNDIRSVHVVRMEVPCCGPLASKVADAVKASGKDVPVRTTVITRDGRKRP
ncbi:MAG: ATP-binding protein [Candidatus Methanomethylophilaceae archaeon]